MPVTPGTRLGVYDITAQIGEGGMGQVFRATDTKLKRQVAIKILSPALAADHDRLARFQREAEVLASLNNPNIAAIYGIEESGGITALVMELVEGEDLSQRIARGAMPLDEALPIAQQIAEALEAAHEQGIIHRDLKPANIKVRSDGTVKVLDFGLAKVRIDDVPDLTHSPTRMGSTVEGVLLGTAPYMSPEQARGKPVNRRADLWAFGAVLYEMLTGQQAFAGQSMPDILVSIFRDEPDWVALPVETPALVRKLLHRCLEKDHRRRLDSAAHARLEIAEALISPAGDVLVPSATPARGVPPAAFAMALGCVALTAVLVTWAVIRPAPRASEQPSRFTIAFPTAQPLTLYGSWHHFAISPDGRHLAYRSGGTAGGGTLMVRTFDQLDARPLPGITDPSQPFFSPDSQSIAFFEGQDLKTIARSGGPISTVCRVTGLPGGASWGDDNMIVYGTIASGLWRVPASGGEPTALTQPDGTQQLSPRVLPGGRGVLITVVDGGQGNVQIAVLDLRTGQRTTLLRGGQDAKYVDLGPTGYLVYAAEDALRAVRFNPRTLEASGDPVRVVEHISAAGRSEASYDVSRTGTLVYVPGAAREDTAPRLLALVDRNGRETELKAPPRPYVSSRFSPDGTRLAVDVGDQKRDVWVWDFRSETLRRLTFDAGNNQQPIWTPDGQRIIFASSREGRYQSYRQAADGHGAVEQLTTGLNSFFSTSITPDGSRVVGAEATPTTLRDISLFSLTARRFEPLVQTKFDDLNGDISPDGRYLSYQSNESGRFEIYVRPFPHVNDGRWQVSSAGGSQAAWAPNGREIFYLDESNRLTAVPVQTGEGGFTMGNPARIFKTSYAVPQVYRAYDIAPDGRQFLMIKQAAAVNQAATASMVVVLNWTEELRQRVPTK